MNKPIQLPASYLNPIEADRYRGERESSRLSKNVMATLRLILARKWLVLGTALVIFGLGLAIAWLVPSIYRANATVLIEATRSRPSAIDNLVGNVMSTNDFMQTQAEFMRSRDVGLRVMRNLNLLDNPYFHKPQGMAGYWRTLTGGLGVRGRSADGETGQQAAQAWALARFQKLLTVEPVRGSQLIRIGFQLPDPVLAAEIVNAVANAYIRSDLETRFTFQQDASRWLAERVEELRISLKSAEDNLQARRESAGIIDATTTSMDGNTRQLNAASEQLVQARVARSQLGLTYRQTRKGEPNRYQVPAVFNSPGVAAAREDEARAERRLSEAAKLYGSAHPAYLSAQSAVAAARANTVAQAEAVIETIGKQYEAAQQTEAALEESLADSRGAISELSRRQVGLEVLEREVATARQVYQSFLARARETSATADFNHPVARVVDPAIPPVDPYNPWKWRLLLLTALGGLLAGALLSLFIERQSEAIRVTDDVESRLHVPLLAAVPKGKRPPNRDLSLLQAVSPQSPFAESIRTAMTSVRLATLDVARPVIMFTSSVADEGKTTLAIAFAIEQARSKRVVLVDADLRRPSVLTKLGRSVERRGLRDAVRGKDLEACLLRSTSLNLAIMGSRPSRRNSLDTLLDPAFATVIAELRKQFDMVVIDAPPIEVVSDASIIAGECDGTVYVVKGGSTPIPTIRRGLARIQKSPTRILGVLLNAHDYSAAARYYGDSAPDPRYQYQAA